jgi:hypothetical protein
VQVSAESLLSSSLKSLEEYAESFSEMTDARLGASEESVFPTRLGVFDCPLEAVLPSFCSFRKRGRPFRLRRNLGDVLFGVDREQGEGNEGITFLVGVEGAPVETLSLHETSKLVVDGRARSVTAEGHFVGTSVTLVTLFLLGGKETI